MRIPDFLPLPAPAAELRQLVESRLRLLQVAGLIGAGGSAAHDHLYLRQMYRDLQAREATIVAAITPYDRCVDALAELHTWPAVVLRPADPF